MRRSASLEFVRGSHRWNRFFMPPSYFDTSDRKGRRVCSASRSATSLEYHRSEGRPAGTGGKYGFEPVPDIEGARDRYDILSWDMAAGDAIVFDALTLHGAPGNPSDGDARRFVTRWVHSSAVLAPHGESTLNVLRQQGFEVPFGVGEAIRGDMFPLLPD